MEKMLELAKTNADRSTLSLGAWWNSDTNDLDTLRKQLEQRLPEFGVRFPAHYDWKLHLILCVDSVVF